MISNAIEQSARISPLPLLDMRIIGEAQSRWAPLKRKYSLYLFHEPPSKSNKGISASGLDQPPVQQAQVAAQSSRIDEGKYVQFANIEEPPLSWDFSLLSASNKLIGSVNRSFAGFARELFTDTGVYALRMDAAGLEEEASRRHVISRTAQQEREYADVLGGEKSELGMTLDQRAVMLATAVTVDYDYFSRHSHSGGVGMMPLWIGGGEAAEGGAAAGGAVGAAGASEAGGAVVGGTGRAVGGAAGAGEGAIAGAGTLAGYEAMQRGVGRGEYGEQPAQQPPVDDASPQASEQQPDPQQGQDVWGQDGQDPWSGQGADSGGGGSGDGGGGGGGGSFWDIFGE
jgi:Scramblase